MQKTETEYRNTVKAIERTKAAISAQVRNMREAGESLRKFIEEDITEMSKDLERLEKDLARIEESKIGNTFMAQELNEVRKKLLSFAEYAKDAQPEELVNLISTVVERIYITTENDKRVCHIFVKGCTTEDYTDLFGGTADYINIEKNPLKFNMCDLDKCSIFKKVFIFQKTQMTILSVINKKQFINLANSLRSLNKNIVFFMCKLTKIQNLLKTC